MTAEQQMLFPFTKKDEILYWATLYTEDQTPKRQRDEEDVRKIRENVKARKKPETPGGYLTKNELMEMGDWKDPRFARSNIKNGNSSGHIEAVTREAFRPGDDWEKLKKLMGYYDGICGVGQSIASTILHLYDPERYPIFDPHALYSIRINKEEVEGDKKFWKEYVKLCREKSECHGVCMRTLDRALYKFSKSGAAFALKTITPEMMFLELKRRGSDLSSLRENDETQPPAGEIVKIS